MTFRWSELEKMAEYGSLFLHHIRLEGRPLTPVEQDGLQSMLETLPPYQRARQEIAAFQVVLNDVELATERAHSPSFELAVIATAFRHAFILGCYVVGTPDFGRTTPFETLAPRLGLSRHQVRDLKRLYQFRLHQHDRAPEPFAATTEIVREWLRLAATLFNAISRRVDEFDRAMH
jgi:hypothetical protein